MPNPVPSFLSKFSTDSKFSIPLPFLWSVVIVDTGSLLSQITGALNKISYTDWRVKGANEWVDFFNYNTLVAQEVTIPQESLEAVVMGPESNRGAFMPGYGVAQRSDFLSRSININFLETQSDIESLVFRPWIVALSVDGLLGGGLRSDIIVTQYDRAMNRRKEYRFQGAFPTNTEGNNLTYQDNEFIVKTVTFGYRKYDVVTEFSQGPSSAPGALDLPGIPSNLA